MIHYDITLGDLAAHRFEVALHFKASVSHTRVSLPVWIPGSYMVREFGRHLSRLTASHADGACTLEQLDKTTWCIHVVPGQAVTLRYAVYAFDNSVRTAWLDTQRGFFNPTSLCLSVEGQEGSPHVLSFCGLPAGWNVATAAEPASAQALSLSANALHYQAASYDELADHPFELGPFWRGCFTAGGVPHEFVVAGAWPGWDEDRLLADTQRICAEQIRFWHGDGSAPFQRYVFLLNLVEDGYGGLEHRASTALIAKRSDLPRQGQGGELSEGYQTLLGLISHEYFHTWNVKRLKPREFLRYDYRRENYSRMLWFFEGFTSYYDDLMLLRAGLIDAPRYLQLVTKTVNSVAGTPGQAVQSVAESSFDAWVKYYRPDENSPNATVSYYTKGALIALLLDLRLRQTGSGSLDQVMRALWAAHHADGLTEAAVLAAVGAVAGPGLAEALAEWVHGRAELPLANAWAAAGVSLGREALTPWAATWGLRVTETPSGVLVKSVLSGGAAAQAGLSAGDEILAVQGWRVRHLEDARAWCRPGEVVQLLLNRQQRITQVVLQMPLIDAPAAQQATLSLAAAPEASALQLRQGWLGV